jgi:hypothetical protein
MFIASKLPRNFSTDAYLYWDNDQLHLGVTVLESSTSRPTFETPTLTLTPTPTPIGTVLGPEVNFKAVDSVGLFDTKMYISGMHSGHSGGKTSSFKQCLFLKRIRVLNIADILVAAIRTRPSPLCYLHLL